MSVPTWTVPNSIAYRFPAIAHLSISMGAPIPHMSQFRVVIPAWLSDERHLDPPLLQPGGNEGLPIDSQMLFQRLSFGAHSVFPQLQRLAGCRAQGSAHLRPFVAPLLNASCAVFFTTFSRSRRCYHCMYEARLRLRLRLPVTESEPKFFLSTPASGRSGCGDQRGKNQSAVSSMA